MNKEYRICSRCIMDTSDPDIVFDEQGICNHCKRTEIIVKAVPYCLPEDEKNVLLNKLVEKIKLAGKGKKYDCIIGVSGGVDSSYVAYLVKKLGLRPLAVHLDNGWDAELAVQNIENICNKLEIDLFTYVIDWEEFKDLQLSFLKASTPDSEIPSDHAITAILYQVAKKERLNYIIAGYNVATESILPGAWSQGHFDLRYIKNVQKKFGKKKLNSFPKLGIIQFLTFLLTGDFYWKIKYTNILDYMSYEKGLAKEIIKNDLGWRDYGGKHCESFYTKFYQSYILPSKFGFDKRRAHLSALIMSSQITREDALIEIQKPLYTSEGLEQDIYYFINKFGMSREDFNKIMNSPLKTYMDYPNYPNSWYYKFIRFFYRLFIKRKGM